MWAMSSKSFIIHKDSLNVLDEFDGQDQIEVAGKLFLAIANYQRGIEQELDRETKLVFSAFKQQFERDNQKYEKACLRNKENAKKRWDKKTEEPKKQVVEKKLQPKKVYPTFEEFVNYAEEYQATKKVQNGKKLDLETMEQKWSSWQNWTDGKGNKFKDWKAKIRANIKYWYNEPNNSKPKQISVGYSRSKAISQITKTSFS